MCHYIPIVTLKVHNKYNIYFFNIIVISKYRQKLLEKGANTIATLPRNFKSRPSYDGVNQVNTTDFFEVLSSCGLHIIKEDASLICRFIDKTGSDMLNFEEFLFALRGRPNEERQNVIDYVYSIFDKEHKGVADANEMRKVFNCQKHPKFKMGKLTESQMFYLYMKNFSNQVKMTVTKKVNIYFFIINYYFFYI